MRIYTSYFGNLRALDRNNIKAISISRYKPQWFKGDELLVFAPTPPMLKLQQKEYTKKFDEILKKLKFSALENDLLCLYEGQDIALCCYEKPPEFCHRELVAKWFCDNGRLVEEFKEIEKVEIKPLSKKEKKEAADSLQLELF